MKDLKDSEDQKPKRTMGEVILVLEHMNDNLQRISRNQVIGALVFGLIILVVLIQGQKIIIKVPGLLEISSAQDDSE